MKEQLKERKKLFSLTALKEWEEAGEPFKEDEEILNTYNQKSEGNCANSRSLDNDTETTSSDKLLLMFYLINKAKLI